MNASNSHAAQQSPDVHRSVEKLLIIFSCVLCIGFSVPAAQQNSLPDSAADKPDAAQSLADSIAGLRGSLQEMTPLIAHIVDFSAVLIDRAERPGRTSEPASSGLIRLIGNMKKEAVSRGLVVLWDTTSFQYRLEWKSFPGRKPERVLDSLASASEKKKN